MRTRREVRDRSLEGSIPISRRSVLVLPGTLTLSRIALARPPSVPPQRPQGRIVIGLSQEPTVFNPLMPRLEVDQGVWFALFNPLWRAEPDGSFQPELATEVPSVENGGVSADGLTWKLKLRRNVKWHDGREFTAEDVKYTLDLINNPKFRASTRQGHALVKDVSVVGPYEIEWRMSRPYAPYLALLAWTFIVPKHVLAAFPDPNLAPFNHAPIGTGPFKWAKRTAGQGLSLDANTDYFGEGPYVERVLFSYVPEGNVLYTQFKTGQIDYIGYFGIPAQFVKDASSLPARKIEKAKFSQIEAVVFNFGNPIFQDKAVRRALYAGLNKKSIVDYVYYGLPTETESFVTRYSWAYNPDLPKHAYDLDAGNKLLDEAGWVRGTDGTRSKAGRRLEFTLATVSGNPQRDQAIQIIQQDWLKLGVAIRIQTMPAAVVFGVYYTKSQFDCLYLSSNYGTGADPDPTSRFSSTAIPAQGGSGLNYYQYKNPGVDKLIEAARTTFNTDERRDAYLRLQVLIREDLAILPICQPTPVEGTKKNLVGYRSNPNVSSNCWNIGSWYWNQT